MFINLQVNFRKMPLLTVKFQRSCKPKRTDARTCKRALARLDAAGNLTSDGLRVFEYDSQNRHSKTIVNDPDEGSKITYLHNALGQRVFKSEPKVDHVAPNATVLGTPFVDWLRINFGWLFAQAQLDPTLGQSYLYDDAQLGSTPVLLAEYGNGSSNMDGRREYIWLPTQDGQAIAIALYRGVNFNAIHTDHLGTPRKVTNWANNTDWQLPYSAFGENAPSGGLQVTTDPTQAYTTDTATATMLAVGPSPISFNFRFPGQYFDDESKLNYNYFRSYQAGQGRYSQSDPIGLAGGLNRFGYAETNPVSFIDADGLVASRDPWFGYGGDKGFKDWWHGQKPYYGGQDIPNKEVCDNLYKDYKESNERGKGSKSGRGGKNRADKRPNVNELIRNGGKGGYGRGED